jgi:shikimate kinase
MNEESETYIQNTLDRPLVLIGLMGVGKTRLGRQLAKRLQMPFYDSDDEIEKAAGMSVSDIFAKLGEDSFRDGEKKVIDRLLKQGPCVIATGGGAIMNEETQQKVAQSAWSIWLKADIATLVSRTSRRKTRPLLASGDPHEILSALADKRYPVYQKADMVLDCSQSIKPPVLRRAIDTIETYIKENHAR